MIIKTMMLYLHSHSFDDVPKRQNASFWEPFILSPETTEDDGGRSRKRYRCRCFDDYFVGFCSPDRQKTGEKEKIGLGQRMADGKGKTWGI